MDQVVKTLHGNSQFLRTHTPAGAFSCRHGCGRPRTWPRAALAWTQRPAGGTRGGCGRRERTDRSRHFHSRAGRAHTDVQNVTPANGAGATLHFRPGVGRLRLKRSHEAF